jgi:hypothetical protein
MHPLSASELLDIWEQGMGESPVNQAVLILSSACPEVSEKEIMELSIGQRDKYLITLHEWTFGSRFSGLAFCPSCGENVELNFSAEEILKSSEENPEAELTVNSGNFDVSFRLPNSQDILSIKDFRNIFSAQQQLTEQCILKVKHEGKEIPKGQIPEYLLEALVNKMAEQDPIADIQLELTCPSCALSWHSTFDIVSYFWAEINAWAHRILAEVHTIASAYGWKEADILAMSPMRRQLYLEMIGI